MGRGRRFEGETTAVDEDTNAAPEYQAGPEPLCARGRRIGSAYPTLSTNLLNRHGALPLRTCHQLGPRWI